jgi:mRNA interferase MazF
VVISRDVFDERSGTVIALAITSRPQRAGYPATWRIPAGILPRDSWAEISQMRTLATERLSGRLGRLNRSDLRAIVAALRRHVEE